MRQTEAITYYVFCAGYLRNRNAIESVLGILKKHEFRKNIKHTR